MRSVACLAMLAAAAAVVAQERGALPIPASGNVTLPLDEYNRLIEMASKPVKVPEAPPLPYTIGSAEMKVEAAGAGASGTIQLEGEVLGKGSIKIPLVTGMVLLDAAQRGTPVPLALEGATHTTVINGPAEFSLTLKAGLPVRIDAGRASLSFQAPAAGAVRLTMSVPGDNTEVFVLPGLITGRTSASGRTAVEATLVPGQATTVSWITRESVVPATPREVRFLSDVKTLISVGEAGLTAAALATITVVQGDPTEFRLELPSGYEVTGVTGPALESSEVEGGALIVRDRNGASRNHQFLVSMERAMDGAKAEAPFTTVRGTQRETGEVLVEGEGAIELAAKESGGLQRMDLREASPYLTSLAHAPLQAAFRYHRQAAETPLLALEWVRFPDAGVIRAVAQRAAVTTMVTSEGRSLTEVKLTLQNQAQPFLKVGLPKGATVVSADVAGEKVKPVEAPDGSRVPLLRTGFRPSGAYEVSFVYMDSGTPFAKKGGSGMTLPKMDVPIGLLEWEVFLPQRFIVTDFGGDAIAQRLMPLLSPAFAAPAAPVVLDVNLASLLPGQLGGMAVDVTGAGVPRTHVTVVNLDRGGTFQADADSGGRWVVSNVPSGRVRIIGDAPGFRRFTLDNVYYDANRPMRYRLDMAIGSTNESIEVTAAAATLNERDYREKKQAPVPQQAQASANVMNLQRRVAGVLPVAVDVPRAGTSFQFVRPLVIDEETRLTFSYKTK